jgi:hypothetical protein
LRRRDDGVERLAPVELPDQGVGQFFVSSFSSALRRWATIEPAWAAPAWNTRNSGSNKSLAPSSRQRLVVVVFEAFDVEHHSL